MSHIVAFYLGQQNMQRRKQSLQTEIHHNYEVVVFVPLIHIVNHPMFTLSILDTGKQFFGKQ